MESISLVTLNVADNFIDTQKIPCLKIKLKSDPALFKEKLKFQAQFTAQNNAYTIWGDQCADTLVAPYNALAEGLNAQYLPMLLNDWVQQNPDSPYHDIVHSSEFREAVMQGGLYLHPGTMVSYQYQIGQDFVKADSTIKITTANMDKTYDGAAVDAPQVTKSGSTKAPTFTYYQNVGNDTDEKWEALQEAPVNAGKYKVVASVAQDATHNKAFDEKKFTISAADNSWTQALAMSGWTYAQQTKTPAAAAQFGNVTFSYSDSEHGDFTDKMPTTAGTWYVKAAVEGTDNYKGMETVKKFTIAPKDMRNNLAITVSNLTNDDEMDGLIVKDGNQELVKGIDYDVEKKQDGNKIIVTITFKGNYTGTVAKTFTVNGTPEEASHNTENVHTGDSDYIGLVTSLGMLSAACMAFLIGKKSKRN